MRFNNKKEVEEYLKECSKTAKESRSQGRDNEVEVIHEIMNEALAVRDLMDRMERDDD